MVYYRRFKRAYYSRKKRSYPSRKKYLAKKPSSYRTIRSYQPAPSRLSRRTPGQTFRQSLAIQRAGYIRISQLVRFSIFRTYVYTNTTTHEFPYIRFWANSPYHPHSGAQPANSWILQDNMQTTDDCPNLDEWVGDNPPAVATTAKYREGRCLGSNIFVSARPKHGTSEGPDTHVDYTALLLHLGTGLNDWGSSTTIGPSNALDNFQRLPFTRKGQTQVNPNGTPKGTSLRMSYKFKDLNKGRSLSNATFYNDTHPGEGDFWYIGLLPYDYVSYVDPTTPETMADHLITVRIEYVCLMSEPNTHLYRVNRN